MVQLFLCILARLSPIVCNCLSTSVLFLSLLGKLLNLSREGHREIYLPIYHVFMDICIGQRFPSTLLKYQIQIIRD
jgi:hypothetical protein